MILLTNLGNRNILFDGNFYIKGKNSDSFKEWSLQLLNKYQDIKERLDLNILNPLVTGRSRPTKIYLFFSDQTEYSTRTDQDTLYEAQIIEKILVDKYNYKPEQIELVRVKAPVIENDELMLFYSPFLGRIKSEINLDNKLIICDAGGTAQQKMSLKLMTEFILKPELYEIKYTQNNQLVEDVKIDVYRKIISTEQAIKLIRQGEYDAAATLLGYEDIHNFHNLSKKQRTKRIFAHSYFRFIQNEKLAKANLNSLESSLKDIYFQNYINNNFLSNNQEFQSYFDKKNFQKISEYLQKSLFYFNIKKYGVSILCFSQFYELFFQSVTSTEFPQKTYGNSFAQSETQRVQFENYFQVLTQQLLETCRERYRDYKIDIGNLASQVLITKCNNNRSIVQIAKIISPHISYTDDALSNDFTINLIRNKIAHEGKYITDTDIKTKLKFYPKLLKSIESVFEFNTTNIFEQVNDILEEILRKRKLD